MYIKYIIYNFSMAIGLHVYESWKITCHNPNLGLVTKAKAFKGASQEGSSGITFLVHGSVGKCEGMNSHTPKWVFTLGVGIPMDSIIFRRRL
jgi:hypothetical protein